MKVGTTEQDSFRITSAATFHYPTGSIKHLDGEEVFMEHRLKQLFYILLVNKNEVSTREELMSYVWKDLVVNDESVSKAISDLRKFFVTHQLEQLTITTIPKVGYKLTCPELVVANNKKVSYPKLIFKAVSYVLLAGITAIILIRAIRY